MHMLFSPTLKRGHEAPKLVCGKNKHLQVLWLAISKRKASLSRYLGIILERFRKITKNEAGTVLYVIKMIEPLRKFRIFLMQGRMIQGEIN